MYRSALLRIPLLHWMRSYNKAYYLHSYAVEIKDKKDFNKWHFETAFAQWLSNDRFQQIGRKDHRRIVQELENILSSK